MTRVMWLQTSKSDGLVSMWAEQLVALANVISDYDPENNAKFNWLSICKLPRSHIIWNSFLSTVSQFNLTSCCTEYEPVYWCKNRLGFRVKAVSLSVRRNLKLTGSKSSTHTAAYIHKFMQIKRSNQEFLIVLKIQHYCHLWLFDITSSGGGVKYSLKD